MIQSQSPYKRQMHLTSGPWPPSSSSTAPSRALQSQLTNHCRRETCFNQIHPASPDQPWREGSLSANQEFPTLAKPSRQEIKIKRQGRRRSYLKTKLSPKKHPEQVLNILRTWARTSPNLTKSSSLAVPTNYKES